MQTTDFDYELPQAQIAQTPAEPRDSSRLLVLSRADGRQEHVTFRNLPDFLRPGDVLVRNVTRVIPARLFGTKEGANAACEFLLLRQLDAAVWEVILRPGRKLRPGSRVRFAPELAAEILSKEEGGVCRVRFDFDGVFEEILDRLGETPLPPYIHERTAPADRYQTVYAREAGSAAAPTAGLHFTPELLTTLERMGVEIADVLLHVGLGTFRPVKTDTVEDHHMHSEHYEVSEAAAGQLNRARQEGRRLICVGTTSVRVLESAFDKASDQIRAGSGETDIFLYPGKTFHATDGMITNFHLPQSTLLMLVAAFAGRETVLQAYSDAVRRGYRFFSFGDAMLIF
ncbi:MAG: tRNA preQ1(34) S-adenosylmethionine ribosyltransferase-isomerase QueA [Clostridia bacterium]|nr:tRNA preQ1(34) S-adenosylmethionine ribosyltransferase-isomerase QueA [Clostridia bacterium]